MSCAVSILQLQNSVLFVIETRLEQKLNQNLFIDICQNIAKYDYEYDGCQNIAKCNYECDRCQNIVTFFNDCFSPHILQFHLLLFFT